MPEINLSDSEQEISELSAIEAGSAPELPFSFLERPENKTTKLAAKQGARAMQGKNSWFNFDFKEPIFLLDLTVNSNDYASYHDFEFRWNTVDGNTFTKTMTKNDEGDFRVIVQDLVTSVKFKPPKAFLRSPSLERVVISGFPRSKLSEYLSLTSKMSDHKAAVLNDCEKAIENAASENTKVTELEAQQAEIKSEIEENRSTVADLNGEIGRLSEERNSATANISSLKETARKEQGHLDLMAEAISERTEERKQLSQQIVLSKSELKGLNEDINMFPTEISEFVKQGAAHIKSYWRLAMLPIATITVVTVLLVFNAANLTTIFDEENNVRIWSILATRVPYVVIATAIIAACVKITQIFVAEIMRINQQRLSLSKISIIANDVSASAEVGLGLSDEEAHTLRTQVKMDMLRDHLKNYLSKDYQYQSRKPIVQPLVQDEPEDSLEEEAIDETNED